MKKTMLIAVMISLVFGIHAMAQFKIPKDLEKAGKDVEKAAGLVQKGSKAMEPWDYADERATGQTVAAQLAKAYGGVWKNEAWTKYINLVGRSLVPLCERPDIKYRFAILNSNEVNAFSCPGGYIFITKGLLKRIQNEAQLAGVLAHEIAHTAKRHVEKGVKQQEVAGVVMEGGLQVAQAQGAKLNSEQVKMVKGLANAGYDLLVKTGFSREDEFEADKLATDNIYKLGYTPSAVIGLLMQIDGEGKVSDLEKVTRTHPPNEDRRKAIKERIKKKKYDTEGRPTNEDRYQKMLQKNPIK